MFGIKVKQHGYFFEERGLETECMCGCIYYTPKKKVEMYEDYHNDDVIMRTTCPECKRNNRQSRNEMWNRRNITNGGADNGE